jgi:hypothetical protein
MTCFSQRPGRKALAATAERVVAEGLIELRAA